MRRRCIAFYVFVMIVRSHNERGSGEKGPTIRPFSDEATAVPLKRTNLPPIVCLSCVVTGSNVYTPSLDYFCNLRIHSSIQQVPYMQVSANIRVSPRIEKRDTYKTILSGGGGAPSFDHALTFLVGVLSAYLLVSSWTEDQIGGGGRGHP